MKLRSNHPGMVSNFGDLHQAPVGRGTAELQTELTELIAVFVVELEAMAMALEDDLLLVGASGAAAMLKETGIDAKPHRSALLGDVLLLWQQINHRQPGEEIEFGAVGIMVAEHRTSKLDAL